jgi:hypothetical protein
VVVLATTWFLGELCRFLSRFHFLCGFVIACVIATYGVKNCAAQVRHQLQALQANRLHSLERTGEVGASALTDPPDADGWVELANRNIAQGGPVWPIFRHYYGRK